MIGFKIKLPFRKYILLYIYDEYLKNYKTKSTTMSLRGHSTLKNDFLLISKFTMFTPAGDLFWMSVLRSSDFFLHCKVPFDFSFLINLFFLNVDKNYKKYYQLGFSAVLHYLNLFKK